MLGKVVVVLSIRSVICTFIFRDRFISGFFAKNSRPSARLIKLLLMLTRTVLCLGILCILAAARMLLYLFITSRFSLNTQISLAGILL